MTSGPNWKKLYEMGKLPRDQYHQIPGLLEKLEREKQQKKDENKTTNIKTGTDNPGQTGANTNQQLDHKCLVEGCKFAGKNANGLRLHAKSHANKETK